MRTRPLVLLVASVPLLLVPACKRSAPVAPSTPATPAPTATVTALEVEGSTASTSGETEAAPAATPTPLALDEAGLKKYLAFRKELATLVRDQKKKMLDVSGKGDAIAQAKAFAEINTALEKGSAALREKYGLGQEQDEATMSAAQAVVGVAISRNSMMAGSIADLKKAAAESGPAGTSAKASLAEIDAREKKGLDDARKQYGSAAVDVLLAHYAEIDQMQKDALNAAMGQ